eukprot:2926288-Rhodomonas_salina.2
MIVCARYICEQRRRRQMGSGAHHLAALQDLLPMRLEHLNHLSHHSNLSQKHDARPPDQFIQQQSCSGTPSSSCSIRVSRCESNRTAPTSREACPQPSSHVPGTTNTGRLGTLSGSRLIDCKLKPMAPSSPQKSQCELVFWT